MKIGAGGLMKLAEMICGDKPFKCFPYRSSSYLTRFFVDIDLKHVHDGSTRRLWVNDALKDLNNKPPASPDMPSPEMVKVIESLLHPEQFISDQSVDYDKAIEAAKKLLKTYDLTIVQKPNGQAVLCPAHGEFISTSHEVPPTEKLVTFKPSVFNIPNKPQNEKLLSVMMPFDAAFDSTFEAVRSVTDYMGLECLRADDIWDNATFMQDIIDLIFCARIVVVDFSRRNPNVMYETGIAHTLGK